MLEISNLRSAFVGPVSMRVDAGECVAIQGASGSGKSLLLRAIVDLDPSDGAVSLDGQGRDAMPADRWRRLVAMVPAESGWWSARVSDHFDAEANPAALLAAVGLADAGNWEVARLSTGERQRLALVRALLGHPRALLLDEPTAALDDETTTLVEQVITDLCAGGAAVVLVTHDRVQSRRLARRSFVLEGGTLAPLPDSDAAVRA